MSETRLKASNVGLNMEVAVQKFHKFTSLFLRICKNTDCKKQIVRKKFLLLSPSENVDMARNNVSTRLQNLIAFARTVPEKNVRE